MVLLSHLHSAAQTFSGLFVYMGSCKVEIIQILWEKTTTFLLSCHFVKRVHICSNEVNFSSPFCDLAQVCDLSSRLEFWNPIHPTRILRGAAVQQGLKQSCSWLGGKYKKANEWKKDRVSFFPTVFNTFVWFSHLWWSYFSGLMRHSGLQFWMQNRVCALGQILNTKQLTQFVYGRLSFTITSRIWPTRYFPQHKHLGKGVSEQKHQ